MIDKSEAEDKIEKNTTQIQINPEISADFTTMASNFPILNKKSKRGKEIVFNYIKLELLN